jgi:hypothetical protein
MEVYSTLHHAIKSELASLNHADRINTVSDGDRINTVNDGDRINTVNDGDRIKVLTIHLIYFSKGDDRITETYNMFISQDIPRQYKSTIIKKIFTCSDAAFTIQQKQSILHSYVVQDGSTVAK